jgi:hypothetical protein
MKWASPENMTVSRISSCHEIETHQMQTGIHASLTPIPSSALTLIQEKSIELEGTYDRAFSV